MSISDIHKRTYSVHHPWHNISPGSSPPDVVTAVVEIPALSRVKTELNKETGLLEVAKILHSSVIYPANYGFIPKTMAEDGDPLDILVLCQLSLPPLTLVKARPIGLMPMFDGEEPDNKIIAVAVNDPEYNIFHDISELPPFKMLMITQFFNDYTTLERKTFKTMRPKGAEAARETIIQAIGVYSRLHQNKSSF